MQRVHKRLVLSLWSCVVGSLGCGNDTTSPAPSTLVQQYWALRLNHHAITLALHAPYDTITLMATPRTATGTLLATSMPVTYTVSDTSVTVDATGRLTAIAPDVGVLVIATATVGGVSGLTLADTAVVNVNDTNPVPHLQTFSIHPLSGDSAIVASNIQSKQLIPRVLDANGDSIPNVVVHYTTSNLQVATISSDGVVRPGLRPGSALLTAEATVYGVTVSDTLTFTVGWPLYAEVDVVSHTPTGSRSPIGIFNAQDDTVGVGAVVRWQKVFSDSIDVIFDDAAAVDSILGPITIFFVPYQPDGEGNILDWTADPATGLGANSRFRRFPSAGTYNYHSVIYHSTGVIHVLANH